MAIRVFERVLDYRVGVSLELAGAATSTGKAWVITRIGPYGPGDAVGKHFNQFDTLKDAKPWWKMCVEDYRRRLVEVNRLKDFKKSWVPSIGENYEAAVFEHEGMMAVMTSQGPRSRRNRIWLVTLSLPKEEDHTVFFFPYHTVGEKEMDVGPKAHAVKVPISRMAEELNRIWVTLVDAYIANMPVG
jgi:hypothetical protein